MIAYTNGLGHVRCVECNDKAKVPFIQRITRAVGQKIWCKDCGREIK